MSIATVLLGDVLAGADVFTDGDWVESKDQDPDGDVRLVQLADVGVGKYLDKSARYMTSQKAEELKCTFIEPGDLLIARMPDPLGRACLFPGDRKPCVTVVDVCIVRPDLSEVDQRWLMHWFNSPAARRAMERSATGTTRKRISRTNIGKLSIPLPPIEEQRRIAAVLDAADALRAKRRQAHAKLDTLTQAIFIDMFGHPSEDRFPRRALDDLVKSRITRGIDQPGPVVENGVPYIKTTNFGAATPIRASLSRTAPEIAAKFPRSAVERGDTVICIRATVGPALLVGSDLEGVNLSRGTARVSPSSDVLPEYLYAAVCSEHFQHQIRLKLRGATFLQIPLGELKLLQIPVPPIDLQRSLVEARSAVEEQMSSMQRHAAQLDNLFAALQQRAFRGEL